MTKVQEYNKRLVERYPFLYPRSRWTDLPEENYNYDWTELDAMPNGWRKVFGEMMCEEIKQELLKFGQEALDDYRILDIKEKYGGLRWYDNGYPSGSNLGDIIFKYEHLSQNICMRCGKPDVPMCGDYWISPFCLECWTSDEMNRAVDWMNWAEERDVIMPESCSYNTWVDGEKQEVIIDVKETAERIREEYCRIRRDEYHTKNS